jgi:hypothetical protein
MSIWEKMSGCPYTTLHSRSPAFDASEFSSKHGLAPTRVAFLGSSISQFDKLFLHVWVQIPDGFCSRL